MRWLAQIGARAHLDCRTPSWEAFVGAEAEAECRHTPGGLNGGWVGDAAYVASRTRHLYERWDENYSFAGVHSALRCSCLPCVYGVE